MQEGWLLVSINRLSFRFTCKIRSSNMFIKTERHASGYIVGVHFLVVFNKEPGMDSKGKLVTIFTARNDKL